MAWMLKVVDLFLDTDLAGEMCFCHALQNVFLVVMLPWRGELIA